MGFHIPSEKEWQELIDFLGGSVIAGEKLRDGAFKAYLGGVREEADGAFHYFGSNGAYWTTTLKDSKSAWGWDIDFKSKSISPLVGRLNTGLSIRCLKD
jgi:uncharacterized protein (TIGR02145 family)